MSSPETQHTKTEQIERTLALKILRGEHAPGTQLPSVRALAKDFSTTPPTIQRVIDRLETAGLVTARRGSGVRVEDPARGFDLALLPLWFEALAGAPERSGQILRDFLELRRVVATHLVRTSYDRIVAVAPRLAELHRKLGEATDTAGLAAADLALTRVMVDACHQRAVGAIFSITERIVREVPAVADALYSDRDYHQGAVGRVLTAFTSGSAERAASELNDILIDWDERAVTRLVQALAEAEGKCAIP